MRGPSHSFNVLYAVKYGNDESIMIHHFQYWINHNFRMKQNFHDGRYWSYQTLLEIRSYFPYFSLNQTRRVLDSLIKKGVLMKGNYNRSSYDRTVWYAFVDEEEFDVKMFGQLDTVEGVSTPENDLKYAYAESDKCICGNPQMDLREPTNGFAENHTPIPDTKTDTLTNKKEKDAQPRVQKEGSAFPSSANASAPPSSFENEKRKKLKQEKKEVFEQVFLTPAEQESLLKRASGNQELVTRWFQRLSVWKISKGIRGGSDYRTILNWVVKAVQEDGSKALIVKEAKEKSLGQVEKNKQAASVLAERYARRYQNDSYMMDIAGIKLLEYALVSGDSCIKFDMPHEQFLQRAREHYGEMMI